MSIKKTVAELLFPVSAPGIYSYRIPDSLKDRVRPGCRAHAELGPRKIWGIVTAVSEAVPERPLKPLLDTDIDTRPLSNAYLRFVLWLSRYYMAPPGNVLRTVYPGGLSRKKSAIADEPDRDAPPALSGPEMLTEEQARAGRAVNRALESGDTAVFLLEGITGSGKSHIYYQAAREAIARDRGVIIMVPEIALTTQTIRNLTLRFGPDVAVYHSRLTRRERLKNWEDLQNGVRRIAVGVRSALFTPVENPGLIIVDEEHDASYSQNERTFNFNARDAAVMRGQLEGAVVVLGSATPSFESRKNAESGKYRHLRLTQRFNRKSLPAVHLVDLAEERKGGNYSCLSRLLQTKLDQTLHDGKQAILLKNRRGFAAFLQCRECGHIPKCTHCDIAYTLHKTIRRLVCHYCGKRVAPPVRCPACGSPELHFGGAGTERIESEVHNRFPDARVLRLDTDSAARKGALENILDAFRKHEADILIGTQMVSKGLDFPDVILVGIVSADTGLFMPDYKSAERTFQLLTQVSGRSGRGDITGRVVLQTYSPDEPAIRFALKGKYGDFYRQEMQQRRTLAFPPFTRTALVRFVSPDENAVARAAGRFRKCLSRSAGQEVLGPAPSPRYKVRNRFRQFIYIKNRSSAQLHENVEAALKKYGSRQAGGVRVQVVFDPDTLL